MNTLQQHDSSPADLERTRIALYRLYSVALAKGLELEAEEAEQAAKDAAPTCREEAASSSEGLDQLGANQGQP